MNPLFLASLRRHWQMIGAIAAFLVFSVIHLAVFRPVAARYQDALQRAGGLEAMFDAGAAHPMLPPRVFALITANSVEPQDATDRGGSGALGVILLEELGRIASRTGLTVQGSEPGVVTQEPLAMQVRAHLRLRGTWTEVVNFYGELARTDGLYLIERHGIFPAGDGAVVAEVWLSRLYLKQPGVAR